MPYFFGVRNGSMSKPDIELRERAAKAHGACFIFSRQPDGPRSWFETPNCGDSRNKRVEIAVLATLARLERSASGEG
jgi:hypothetical protein